MDLNEAQEEAVRVIDENLIVNAGAGTGKTSVLSKRYLEILENGDIPYGDEVESIVAITFTKKASREMIERIRGEIRGKFNEDEKWIRFYDDMEKANISTIHSFCNGILKEKPIEAKLDPMFEVLEDYTGKRLLNESIRQVLNDYLSNSEDLFKFLRLTRKNHVEDLIDDLNSIYNEIRTYGNDFENMINISKEKIEKIKFEEGSKEEIKDIFSYLMENLGKASKIVKLKEKEVWERFLKDDYQNEELVQVLLELKENMSSSKKEEDRINRLNELLDAGIDSFEVNYLWAYELIGDILIDIDRTYEDKKIKLKVLDYDDLQIKTLKLLENDSILSYYQKKFRYIMIDEYQDTNELQRKIFYKLSTINKSLDRNNLFVVGDPKQSVYGFRGADVNVFYNTMEDIKRDGRHIVLEKNYRTQENLLHFINKTFESILADKYISLVPHIPSKKDKEVFLIEKDMEFSDGENESELLKDYEVRNIAKEISELVRQKEYDYGDFAILFRAGTRTEIYEAALKEYKIPYYNTIGKGFYSRQEVLDLINFLKFISNREDTISGIGLLRCPLVGLNDISIYKIISRGGIYEGLKNVDLDFEENVKKNLALKLLDNSYRMKSNQSIYDILEYVVEESYFREKLLLLESGKQKIANVNKFMELAYTYDLKHNLEDFLAYLDGMMMQEEAEGETESEKANVVRIMTIHKSKGLEFPVVILPEMAIRSPVDSKLLNLDKNLGVGIKLVKDQGIYKSISELKKEKDAKEMERVLYVAMTRAKERIIIGNQGSKTGFKKLLDGLLDSPYVDRIDYEDLFIEETYEDLNLGELGKFNGCLPAFREYEDFNLKSISSINISQYIEYKKCKRKYFLNYFDKLDMDVFESNSSEEKEEVTVLNGIIKGNIIHKFCEDYRIGNDREKVLENAVRYFNFNYEDDIKRQLVKYVDNYLKFYSEEYDKIYREQEFYLSLGKGYIRGIIDVIYIKNGEITIVDYKTNRLVDVDDLTERYKPQIQLYAYVVSKNLKKKVKNAGIYFLEKGIYRQIDISDDILDNNIKDIREFLDFINKNQNISSYEKCKNCEEGCKFYSICN